MSTGKQKGLLASVKVTEVTHLIEEVTHSIRACISFVKCYPIESIAILVYINIWLWLAFIIFVALPK